MDVNIPKDRMKENLRILRILDEHWSDFRAGLEEMLVEKRINYYARPSYWRHFKRAHSGLRLLPHWLKIQYALNWAHRVAYGGDGYPYILDSRRDRETMLHVLNIIIPNSIKTTLRQYDQNALEPAKEEVVEKRAAHSPVAEINVDVVTALHDAVQALYRAMTALINDKR